MSAAVALAVGFPASIVVFVVAVVCVAAAALLVFVGVQ